MSFRAKSRNLIHKKMQVDILAIGVHPDDVELSCAGTVLKHISLGKTVGLLDLTLGEMGTRGNAEIRTQEAMKSAKILGVSFRKQLNFADCFFENKQPHIVEIVKVIRDCKPQIILCNAISDRHPDHGRAAKLVADACFYSGLVKIDTQQPAWRPKAVYHYIQDNYIHPHFVVDITEFAAKKWKPSWPFLRSFMIQILKSHKRQFPAPSF